MFQPDVPHLPIISQLGRRTSGSSMGASSHKIDKAAASHYFHDEDLLDRAEMALAAAECRPLALPMQPKWKWSETRRDFSLFKRSMRSIASGGERPEVLCSGRLQATVQEVASILHSTDAKSFENTMKGLYGKAFIFGSVEHTVEDQDNQHEPCLSVKTASFVHADAFGKNDQWCFFDYIAREPDMDGCRIVLKSLLPQESPHGRLPAANVNQLQGLVVQYSIEPVQNECEIRVQFYGAFDMSEIRDCDTTVKNAKARLDLLARGMANLPDLVQRRRFGMQVLADQAQIEVKNPNCTCCTKKFYFFSKRLRCYVCGYFVCDSCSTDEHMETFNGRLASIIACRRCIDGVNACNYAHIGPIDHTPLRVIPDPPNHRWNNNSTRLHSDRTAPESESESSFITASFTSDNQENSFYGRSYSSSSNQQAELDIESSSASSISTLSASSQILIGQLEDTISSDGNSPSRRDAAVTILKYLLSEDESDIEVPSFVGDKWQKECATYVERALDVSSYPSDPDKCEFASAVARNYAIQVAPSMDSSMPDYPVPHNEAERLAAIAKSQLDLINNVVELNELCALAAAEMDCPHGIITLIEKETVAIIAANNAFWTLGSRNDRNQTFCQHFVMDDRPLLVRHPEADIRFYNLNPVVHANIHFYVGFPVRAEDGTIVAALCCMAGEGREVTRTQYWRVMKLADAASKIMQAQSNSQSA